jgi:rhodanese-related sulfurtransferase
MKKTIMGMLFIIIVLSLTACAAVNNKSVQNIGGSMNTISTEDNASNVEKSTSITVEAKTASYSDISPKAAKERLEKEEGIILLDVGTLEEYIENHIPGSILIPVDEIRSKASEILTDKNAEIIVYCRSGRRSVTASETLIDMGYTNVYNLGGIIDWTYETESGAPEEIQL